jgi:hypothetical protein
VIIGGAPFGLDFDQEVDFILNEGGLELVQSLLDARNLNVKVLPVLGSPAQAAGYFKAPIGKVNCPDGEKGCVEAKQQYGQGIGLEGLCQAGWSFRFLPLEPIDFACNQLVAEGVIPAKSLTVAPAVGGQSPLQAVQLGSVTAVEFASPYDDSGEPPSGFLPALPPPPIPYTAQNPGHKGLRFAHWPSFHQKTFT